jgi:hypothetical protein
MSEHDARDKERELREHEREARDRDRDEREDKAKDADAANPAPPGNIQEGNLSGS